MFSMKTDLFFPQMSVCGYAQFSHLFFHHHEKYEKFDEVYVVFQRVNSSLQWLSERFSQQGGGSTPVTPSSAVPMATNSPATSVTAGSSIPPITEQETEKSGGRRSQVTMVSFIVKPMWNQSSPIMITTAM